MAYVPVPKDLTKVKTKVAFNLTKRQILCLSLPEREVQRVPFALAHLHARARLQLVQALLAELAVAGPAADVEVDVPVRDVGVPLLDNLPNDADDLRHVLRGERRHVGTANPQRVSVLVIFRDETRGQVGDLDPLRVGAIDHLVVDIREVLDEGDLVARVFQVAAQDVKDDEGPRVADMEEVVDRRAAAVEGHVFGL